MQLLIIEQVLNKYFIRYNGKVNYVSYNNKTIDAGGKNIILKYQHLVFINGKYKKSMSTKTD